MATTKTIRPDRCWAAAQDREKSRGELSKPGVKVICEKMDIGQQKIYWTILILEILEWTNNENRFLSWITRLFFFLLKNNGRVTHLKNLKQMNLLLWSSVHFINQKCLTYLSHVTFFFCWKQNAWRDFFTANTNEVKTFWRGEIQSELIKLCRKAGQFWRWSNQDSPRAIRLDVHLSSVPGHWS